MRIVFVFLLLANVACRTAPALQPSDGAAADIDRFVVQTLHQIPDVPGVGIAVVRDGKPYLARGFGFADVEEKRAAGAETGYYIASSTKSYTGLACAILAGRGVIDLDAPITTYLPEVRMSAPLDATRLTLRQLLTHTSGIENNAIVFRTAFTGEHTPAGLVTLLGSSKPGKEGFRYDNLGYVVASLILERVTGRPWQQVLDELVFTPLGMDHTTAYMSEAKRWRLASPYEMTRKGEMARLMFEKNDQMMHAAGGIVTTPSDLVRWLEANVNRGRVGSRQVIPAAAFDEAHRQQVTAVIERDRFKSSGYGLGWYQARYDDDAVLFHHGGFEGWRAHVSFMPEKKIGVAVMTNSGGPARSSVLNLIASYIYDRILEKPAVSSTEQLARLVATVQQQKERSLADVEKRAQRPWMLQHPREAYAGRYENSSFGALTIEERGGALLASLAQLHSVVEPFIEPESARVELVPGQGEVLRFVFSDGPAPDAVKWGDEVFRRVK